MYLRILKLLKWLHSEGYRGGRDLRSELTVATVTK